MPKFDVTIRAVITKTYEVEAETQQLAEEEAHSIFSVLNESGVSENYEQDTTDVELLCE
jgi:hypothetical protein